MSKINQKLLTEIFRQKELMGIKQILSEGKGLDLIKDLFNISDTDQSFIRIFDDAMEDIKISNPSLIQDIERNFGINDVSFSSLKNSPLRRTINFTQNSAILENILEDLSKSLTKVIYSGKNPIYERLADKIIEESLKGFPTNKQAYDMMVNLAMSGDGRKLDEYISRVRSYFDDEIIEYVKNVKFKPNAFNDIYDQISKKFGEAWVTTVKGWDKIKDFGTYLRELVKKNSVLEGVFTTQPVSSIAKMMRIDYNKLMVNPIGIKRDLDEIFGRIMDKFERGESTDITKEQNELTAKFTQFLSKRDESHKMIYTQWMNIWKQDPRLKRLFSEKKLVDTGQLDRNRKPIFREEPEEFYFKNSFKDEKFLEIMDAFEKANGTDVGKIKQTYSKYDGSIKMMKNVGGIFKFKSGRYFLNLFELFQRLLGTVLFWTPNIWKELAHNRKVLGTKRWVGLGVGQKVVTSTVMVPILLGVYKTFGSAVQDMVNEKRRSEAKEGEKIEFMDWLLLDDNEWSSIMGNDPGWTSLLKLLKDNILDFSVASFDELGTKPAAWSLAAWYFIENPPADFLPSTFKKQSDSVQQNSKVELDTLNQMSQNDPEIKKVIDSMKIQNYDTLVQRIDSTLKNLEY